jgi:hypothetical protein
VYDLLNDQIAAELGVTDSTVRAAHQLGHAKRQGYSSPMSVRAAVPLSPPLKARSCYYASDRHHGLIDRGRSHPYG